MTFTQADIVSLINDLYNLPDGIQVYASNYQRFISESIVSKPEEFYPELVKQCVPATAVAGHDLEWLTQFAIDIIDVLGNYGCNNRQSYFVIHFIHRMIVANL